MTAFTSPSFSNFAATVPVVPPPRVASPAPDVIDRIESTLEELDALWAELETGEFELPTSMETEGARLLAVQSNSRQERKAAEDAKLKACKVSIVVPVYNEHRTILRVIERLQSLPLNTEIIVVDDGSTDGTRGWLETVRGTPGLKLILKEQNEGKGAALRSGFAAATGDVVIVQDADLEYDPADLPAVIRPVALGRADAAFGSRYLAGHGEDLSFIHRAGNGLLTFLSNCFTGLELTDMETCYKAIRRKVLQDIPLQQNRFGFEPEITAKLARRKYRVVEVPISYRPRTYREGKKIGLKDLFSAVYCMARYGWKD